MQRFCRNAGDSVPLGDRTIHETARTYDSFFANNNILRGNDGGAHTNICAILYDNSIMSLFPTMAGKIDSIRNCNILPDFNLVIT